MAKEDRKNELNEEELEKTTGGMKIILKDLIEKHKKEFLDMMSKIKKNQG